MKSFLVILTFFVALSSSIANETIKNETNEAINNYVKKNGLNEKYLLAMSVTNGSSLADAVSLLGEPASQDIDQYGNETVIRCQWNLGGGKSLYANFVNGKAAHISPEGFSVGEFAKYKTALEDMLKIKEREKNEAKQREDVVYNDKVKNAIKKRSEEREKHWANEVKESREWVTVRGGKHHGMIVGIEGRFVLIKRIDSKVGTDIKPQKVEAIRLDPLSRHLVEIYCNQSNIPIPEINPSEKIQIGYSRKAVESWFGSNRSKNILSYALSDNILVHISIKDEKVSRIDTTENTGGFYFGEFEWEQLIQTETDGRSEGLFWIGKDGIKVYKKMSDLERNYWGESYFRDKVLSRNH